MLSLLLLLSKYELQKGSENCSPELDLQIALLTWMFCTERCWIKEYYAIHCVDLFS